MLKAFDACSRQEFAALFERALGSTLDVALATLETLWDVATEVLKYCNPIKLVTYAQVYLKWMHGRTARGSLSCLSAPCCTFCALPIMTSESALSLTDCGTRLHAVRCPWPLPLYAQAMRIYPSPDGELVLMQVKHRSSSPRWGGLAMTKHRDTGLPLVSICETEPPAVSAVVARA